MAANIITQTALIQPKLELSDKTLQNLSLSHLTTLSPPSSLSLSSSFFGYFCCCEVYRMILFYIGFAGVGFLQEKRTGIVVKASLASSVLDSNSSVLEKKKNTKNPIVVIDNYDSFTYNLCQYMGELGCCFEVYRNDEITVEELKRKNPRGLLISPGPGTPQDSGISLQTVLELGPSVPLFGVCMGLQCIGQAFGGKIVRAPFGVMHGKSSLVYFDEKEEDGLFSGLSNPFNVGRYHSLVIEKDSFPGEALEVTAWTEDGVIMAARHKVYKHLQGVQFHPESIITSEGKTIVRNFIKLL